MILLYGSVINKFHSRYEPLHYNLCISPKAFLRAMVYIGYIMRTVLCKCRLRITLTENCTYSDVVGFRFVSTDCSICGSDKKSYDELTK